jgi:signal transduction histidine kinase
VIACNPEGVWNQTGATVALFLQPHFWQTWWFLGLCALTLAGSVGGGVRYITKRRMQRHLEKLERQHAVNKERARIAQDMHDDLGARLTEILLLNDRAQHGPRETQAEAQAAITEATCSIAQNLDAIVWAVSPRNDTLEKTVLYLWDYVEKFLAKSPIRCRVDMPDDWPSVSVSSEIRHNLFLVIKEAANNIVKYAEATEVWLRLRFEGDTLTVLLEDNGKGFSVTGTDAFGNGLVNMKKRMEIIDGELVIHSEPGKGTRIRMEIPLRR